MKNTLVYNVTLRLIFIGLIITFLIVGKPILLPLGFALLFSFLLLPISSKLEEWKFPRVLAIIISLLIAITVVAGLVYFFYKQIQIFVTDWPELSSELTHKIEKVNRWIHETFNYTEYEQKTWLNERLTKAGESAGQVALGVFTATGTFVASVALLPIFIFFLTYYRFKFANFIRLVFKDGKDEHVLTIMQKISTISQKYLKGVLLVVFILSVLNSTGFMLFGLRHAILFGVLLAFLNIIPYVGVMLGSALPITMALVTEDSIGIAIGVAGVCVVVQFLENNFITPNIVGSSVSINPFVAIIGLTTAALIWGVFGMVLVLPFLGMLKVVFDNIDSLKPYGYLIGEEHNYSPDNRFAKRIFSLRTKITKPDKSNKS